MSVSAHIYSSEHFHHSFLETRLRAQGAVGADIPSFRFMSVSGYEPGDQYSMQPEMLLVLPCTLRSR